jgi:ribosomal protein S18 acetylase RimI-like enzyme
VVLARSVEPNVLAVDRLGVSAAHRRRGVSAAGFAAFAARCAAAGVETLEFQVRASNAAATALVADRLGARRVKEERFYVKTGWGGTAADQSAEPGGSGAA